MREKASPLRVCERRSDTSTSFTHTFDLLAVTRNAVFNAASKSDLRSPNAFVEAVSDSAAVTFSTIAIGTPVANATDVPVFKKFLREVDSSLSVKISWKTRGCERGGSL